jgi:hypothetical protein
MHYDRYKTITSYGNLTWGGAQCNAYKMVNAFFFKYENEFDNFKGRK